VRAPQRLLGLERHEHVLQEELKYERVQIEVGQDLVFRVAGRQGQIQVSAEEVLISLIGKAKNIIESHGLALSIAYVSIPAYLGQEERAGLQRCGEIALGKPVRLVEEWTAVGCQYAYTRVKEIRSLEEMRHVLFLDVGYSKVSLSLVQFGRFEARLVDWQHLPYTGAKNMDRQLSEFYNENFLAKHQLSIIDNPKSYIKLLDAIQRQRTVLSANNDHHLNL
jgi:molecular chaperone DnaK (HSP70)